MIKKNEMATFIIIFISTHPISRVLVHIKSNILLLSHRKEQEFPGLDLTEEEMASRTDTKKIQLQGASANKSKCSLKLNLKFLRI